jgi:flagellar biosynthetic protein FliR
MEIDYNLLIDQFRLYFLVFVRITAMVVAAPVLGNALIQVPPQLIAGLGSALTLVVMMNLDLQTALPPVGWAYGTMVIGEAILGLSIGFVAALILAGVQFGGEVIDHLIGFAVVDVIDPVTNESASLIGNFKGLLATVLFLIFHGHLHLFRGVMRTFDLVPPGGVGLAELLTRDPNTSAFLMWNLMERYAEAMFVVGIQVAAPCLIVMTLLWVPEGFLARMVPQLNLLINDIPLRIGLGLFVVWLGVGPFINLTQGLVDQIALATGKVAASLVSR